MCKFCDYFKCHRCGKLRNNLNDAEKLLLYQLLDEDELLAYDTEDDVDDSVDDYDVEGCGDWDTGTSGKCE